MPSRSKPSARSSRSLSTTTKPIRTSSAWWPSRTCIAAAISRKLPSIKQSSASVIRVLNSILERGAKQGVFRSDVNAIDLHLFISAFCVFRVSNRFTFGKIFDCDLSDPAVRARHKKIFTEAVLRYLEPRRNA